MFSAFTNSLKIPELRSRIFYTLALLFVARVGCAIPLPGIDPHPLQEFFKQQSGGTSGAMIGFGGERFERQTAGAAAQVVGRLEQLGNVGEADMPWMFGDFGGGGAG